MSTTHEGTSLKSLADVARKHGFDSKGPSLTYKGLMKQKLPVIALVSPGQFVIIDKATSTNVTIWNPESKEGHKPTVVRCSIKDWNRIWKGITLAL